MSPHFLAYGNCGNPSTDFQGLWEVGELDVGVELSCLIADFP